MKRLLYALVSAAVMLVLSVTIAAAQTTPPNGAPGAGGLSPGATPSPPMEKLMDGPVKKVDQASNTVQVGWLFGLLSTTLAVTDDTQIAVEGAKGSLADIREGDMVKAAYEVREGKNIAKSIDITHGEPAEGAARPGATSGSGTSPMQAPGGSSAPPSGAPKSP
jgi:hypothetical protein